MPNILNISFLFTLTKFYFVYQKFRAMNFLDYKVFILPESEKYFSAIAGLGKKGVIVVYLDENSEALDDFLKKILAATKMDIENDLFLLPIPNETIQEKKPFLRFKLADSFKLEYIKNVFFIQKLN